MNLQTLREVNDRFNLLPFQDDPAGLDDWSPIVDAGDCDSYAVAKLRALVALGADIKDLRLATCGTETGEYHAVLIVSLPDGDYMLDNRQSRPVPVMQIRGLGYTPALIQRVGGAQGWAVWTGSETL